MFPDEDRGTVIDRNQLIWRAFGVERYSDDIWWLPGSPEVAYAKMDNTLLAGKATPDHASLTSLRGYRNPQTLLSTPQRPPGLPRTVSEGRWRSS